MAREVSPLASWMGAGSNIPNDLLSPSACPKRAQATLNALERRCRSVELIGLTCSHIRLPVTARPSRNPLQAGKNEISCISYALGQRAHTEAGMGLATRLFGCFIAIGILFGPLAARAAEEV